MPGCVAEFGTAALAPQNASAKELRKRGFAWEIQPFNVAKRTTIVLLWTGIVTMMFGLAGSNVRMRTWVVTTSSILFLAFTSGAFMFTMALAEGLSEGMLRSMISDIRESTKSGPDIWWRLSDRYRDIDIALERIWKDATLVYMPYFTLLTTLLAIAICFLITSIKERDNKAVLIAAPLTAFAAFAMMKRAYNLARITELRTNTRSTEDSIITAATGKLGLAELSSMEERQAHTHFLMHLQMSPTGVHMIVLIDFSFVGRVAVPLMNAFFIVFSYLAIQFDL
jgi:hypothetical protein